jgi:hypothetical protein
MAKEPPGWVQCGDHLPCYKDSACKALVAAAVHDVFTNTQGRSKTLAVVIAKAFLEDLVCGKGAVQAGVRANCW